MTRCARIADGLRWLERTGVDFLAMPANLPHLYFDTLRREVTAPLLNLVDAAVDALPAGLGSVAVVATRPIRDAAIYQSALERIGVQARADDAMQETVDELLTGLWAGQPRADLALRWAEFLQRLGDQGASAVLLACTDFNAIGAVEGAAPPLVDATRLMAREVVGTWRRLALERGWTKS